MNWMIRVLSVAAMGSVLCLQSGCLLVAAGAATGATVAYVKGDLNSTFDAPADKVAAATKAAMEKMQISVISVESSSVDAKVVGRTARDTKLTVSVKSSTGTMSQVSIRAGTFGDDALQSRLLDEIRSQLGVGTAAATPSTQPTLAGEQRQ